MSRLCLLRFRSMIKDLKASETIWSRSCFKNNGNLKNIPCLSCRGYAQYSSRLLPLIYPLHKFIDRIFFYYKEKDRKYDDKWKYCKRLGILLGSLGFIVVSCDSSHVTGMYIIDIIMYIKYM